MVDLIFLEKLEERIGKKEILSSPFNWRIEAG